MEFDKVLLLRAFDSHVKEGALIAHEHNDYIFKHIQGDKAKQLLDKNLANPEKIKTRGKRRAIVVGVLSGDEVMDTEAVIDYLKSYGIIRMEHRTNKRIVLKLVDNKLVIENLEDVFKNRKLYDYIDTFTEQTKVKYLKSKDSFLCKEDNKVKFKNLILKAEMRCQIIKEEYEDVFGTTPDQ